MKRLLLLGLLAIPADPPKETHPLLILRCDQPRFDDTVELAKLLRADVEDMDIHLGRSVNLERIRREDRLYAKIQQDRGDCRRPF